MERRQFDMLVKNPPVSPRILDAAGDLRQHFFDLADEEATRRLLHIIG